ncbi:hypothetical protein [Desulfosporosinus sp. SB140]|uniref:hypothetical protein n=1 Tax=Desulfosporosinus paludis TaxID=3115649 RepID=UPI00388D94B6
MAFLEPRPKVEPDGYVWNYGCNNLELSTDIASFIGLDYSSIDFENFLSINSIAQVIFGFFYHTYGKHQRAELTIPSGLSQFEVISLTTIRTLASACRDVRMLLGDQKQPVAIYFNEPSEDAMNCFCNLKKNRKIDPTVDIILRRNSSWDIPEHRDYRVFELVNTTQHVIDIYDILLNNYFINFLLNETIKNRGAYGFPLCGWQQREIEETIQFDFLCAVFEGVQFVGYGQDWFSTHLIVTNPRKRIFETVEQITTVRGLKWPVTQ